MPGLMVIYQEIYLAIVYEIFMSFTFLILEIEVVLYNSKIDCYISQALSKISVIFQCTLVI
jgi:hypothetical protein